MTIITAEKRKFTDRAGNTCATLHPRLDGKIELRDKTSQWKGTYDPKTDKTYDPRGNLIGGGNWLAALIDTPWR
jgi:hypothetical protein